MEVSKAKLLEELSCLKAENASLRRLDPENDQNPFKIIFEQSALGNKIIDASLRIIKVNKALLRLLGYKEEELIGAQITDFAHPDHVASWRKLQKELWTRKKPSFSIDTGIVKKNGTTVSFRVTSIIFPNNNETLGYTILEDITERIELNRLKEEGQRLQFDIEKNEIDKINRKKSVALVLDAQEKERTRIAEGLHNSIGQTLFGVKLSLERLMINTNSVEENSTYVQHSINLLDDAIKETRRISHDLTPAVLIDYGLQTALEEICEQYLGTLSIRCRINCVTKDLDKYLATTIYRTAQELILNVVKHASADSTTISLSRTGGSIVLKVADDGRGFNSENGSDGIGLKTIRSKVHLLNGTIDVVSKANHGTSIIIALPVGKEGQHTK